MFYVSYLWFPVFLIFLVLFFLKYRRDTASLREKNPLFSDEPAKLPLRKGHMISKDYLLLGVLCVVYALTAFLYLGNTFSPQSCWTSSEDSPSVTISFEEPVYADTLFYFPYLGTGSYQVELSSDGVHYSPAENSLDQSYAQLFKWNTLSLGYDPISSIRITADNPGMQLAEIGFCYSDYSGTYYQVTLPQWQADNGALALLDEQDTVPELPTHLNSSYFDEIYHPRTALEHLQNIYPYEITHPPLGKLLIALGIRIFGMTPFGWRFMGTFFGVLMLPVLYVFLKSLFGKTMVAICGSTIFAFEFMHFTQTRLATIDTYSVFFTLLMYLFFWFWVTALGEGSDAKAIRWLFLCGIGFGLGVCCKWTCLYSGLGLLILYIIVFWIKIRASIHNRSDGSSVTGFIFKTLAVSALSFIVLPMILYTLCYIPYASASNEGLTLHSLLYEMVHNQSYMFSYHGQMTATHPYQSYFYQWILDIRPILYYRNYSMDLKSAISCLNNPLVCYGGFISMIACCAIWFRRKEFPCMMILVGYLTQLVPWMMITRPMFSYHYFTCSVFLVIAFCTVFSNWIDAKKQSGNRAAILITSLSVILFILFYPSLSGFPVSEQYILTFLKWLPLWPL